MGQSRRRWGWHPLKPRHAREIVADADLPRRSLVLDIGAGLGAITGPLIEDGHRVIAVESHPGRARELERRFGGRITVLRTDARELRLPRRSFHVVASPPYAITTDLLRLLLQRGSCLETAHLVLQEQAARRWVAGRAPGAGRWLHDFDLSVRPKVPRHAFSPPPAVSSVVLVIRRRS